MNKFEQFSNDELADELEDRGCVVYDDANHLIARDLLDEEIISEYESRGLGPDPDELSENIEKEIYTDIYDHAKSMKPYDFLEWLNGKFIKKLECWL